MKTFLLSLYVTVLTVYAVPLNNDMSREGYPRFIEMPGDDGNIHLVDLDEKIDSDLLNDMARKPNKNEYLLYTKNNTKEYQLLVINNRSSITGSNFNARVPTIVISHGWHGNQNAKLNPVIRDAYLGKSDVNVIVLDWQKLASLPYSTAVSAVPDVGRWLGRFLNFLNQVTGAPFNTMHLIGFSLGAHLVGNAGRELEGRAARVTGLDPAGPLWHKNRNRFNSSDGVYTEAIHTDDSFFGFGIRIALAKADFFPNGGDSQPGCFSNLCNHNRAWELFAATVTHNNFVGRQCSDTLQIRTDSCRGKSLNMGNDDLNKRGIGLYRVNTGRIHPF